MAQALNLHSGVLLSNKLSFYHCPSKFLQRKKSCSYVRNDAVCQKQRRAQSFSADCLAVADHGKSSSLESEDYVCDQIESEILPHIQTLRRFPKEELLAKVILVRFDSTILLGEEVDHSSRSFVNAIFTIKYLHEVGAKVILVSDWRNKINSDVLATEYVADVLSSALQYKVVAVRCLSCKISVDKELFEKADIILLDNLSEFKEEVANCSKFAHLLSSGVDIFVNDSFSQSHKILASTVGVARFCYACLAGFYFEESLCQLRNAAKLDKKPYVAIIGGGNLYNKAAALHFLASRCDGLMFVGMMSFQIMHALKLFVPSHLLEKGANEAAVDLIQIARDKNITVLYPNDFWCTSNSLPEQLEIFPAHGIPDGWEPVDIGPRSEEEINSIITKCKKIIWIGPVKFRISSDYTFGASKLARRLCKLSQGTCDVTVVGSMVCRAITKESSSILGFNMVESASAVWEFLKGRKLPGVEALDRAYPFEIDWNAAYHDPAQPLVVDVGSGNGLFLLGMAKRRKDCNFLGLEINEKLVKRCLDSVQLSGIKNGHFIATNATSTFRSIVASYPGKLILVSIQATLLSVVDGQQYELQKLLPDLHHRLHSTTTCPTLTCPNPDFNKPEHRWRMLQRSLVEAVADLLVLDGKVFLQSDIKEVAMRMKEQFLKYGKGKLSLVQNQCDTRTNLGAWLEGNPFGVKSDWEQHVIDRGAPMYRLMLSKQSSVL